PACQEVLPRRYAPPGKIVWQNVEVDHCLDQFRGDPVFRSSDLLAHPPVEGGGQRADVQRIRNPRQSVQPGIELLDVIPEVEGKFPAITWCRALRSFLRLVLASP